MTEMAANAAVPARTVDIPVVADAATGRLRIGHPMGVMAASVEAEPCNAEGGVRLTMPGFSRTARRIMDGVVYVPRGERTD